MSSSMLTPLHHFCHQYGVHSFQCVNCPLFNTQFLELIKCLTQLGLRLLNSLMVSMRHKVLNSEVNAVLSCFNGEPRASSTLLRELSFLGRALTRTPLLFVTVSTVSWHRSKNDGCTKKGQLSKYTGPLSVP